MMQNQVIDHVPLIQDLDAELRALLLPIFYPCDFYPDGTIFEQGDPAEFLYFVVTGEVVVEYKPDDGPPITVARVSPGGVVGWSAALGSRAYTSGAMCPTYSQLVRVRGSELRKVCQQNPEAGKLILDRLATVIAERLSNSHDKILDLLQLGLYNGNSARGEY